MHVFRDYTFRWWQVSLLKLCMVAFGIAVGATWPWAFAGWTAGLWIVFVVLAAYLMIVGFRQMRSPQGDGTAPAGGGSPPGGAAER